MVTGDDGRVAGLVTLNDVLTGIVGDMPPVHEVVAPGVVKREDGSWLVDGLIPFHQFAKFFRLDETRARQFPTLHAFMVDRLESPASRADVVHWGRLRLEVVDIDGTRVDQVLVTRAPDAPLRPPGS